MKKVNILYYIALCQGLFKGYSIILMLLLPILYVEKVIPIIYIGYLGTAYSIGAMLGVLVLNMLNNAWRKIDFINFTSYLCFLLIFALLFTKTDLALFIIYFGVGFCYAAASAVFQAFKGEHTTQEDRIKIFAYLDIISDFFKVIYPVIATLIYAQFGTSSLIYFLAITVVIYMILLTLFKNHIDHKHETLTGKEKVSFSLKLIPNKKFNFYLFLEFLDSVASQALFVFVPTLFLFKNFTINNALIFQAIVFFGYLSGRIFVSKLSEKFGSDRGLIYAFLGQAITLILLAIIPANPILYLLCFFLGVFGRGTTPVINGSAYNQLDNSDFKRGSSLYGIAGAVGDIFSQFSMGLALAYIGPQYPFYFSVAVCLFIVIIIWRSIKR